ncbi:hypothetical protein HYDPIDRAFT_24193 [Hydnomerulius pinastri MD-312]|nr:hypothetical protein HYDPIDRAFT_24193 [Hydnomerulius pinastri MD-312]
MRIPSILGFVSLALPFATASHWSKRHQEVANRARGDVDISKRSFSGARFTFYDVGLGACGKYNSRDDFIVALNAPQYGGGYPGPQCFKSITISFGGKQTQATIMDECMGCPYGGLDFSRGLFDFFSDEGAGVIYGDWWFNDGSGGGGGDGGDGGQKTTTKQWTPPKTTTTHKPTTTWTPPPPPTTTEKPTPTTSLSIQHTTSSTTHAATSATSSTASIDLSTGLVSGLAVPTVGVVAAPEANAPQNLVAINNVLIEVGVLLKAAKQTN